MKAKILILLLVIAALIGGIILYLNNQKTDDAVVTAPPQAPPVEQPVKTEPDAPSITSAMLTGTWAPEASNCETDDIWKYNADGTMATFGADGTWVIDGETLTETITRQMSDNPDNGEVWTKLETPEMYSSTVSIDDSGQMTKKIGAEELTLIKCS